MIGSVAALTLIVIIFLSGGEPELLPIVVLSCSAVLLTILAQHGGYTFAFIHSFFMFFLALMLYVFRIEPQILSLITGLVIGASLVSIGFFNRRVER
jgi:hypothetical protein